MTADYVIKMLAVVMPPHKTVLKTYKKKVWRHPSLFVFRLRVARNWSLLFANNKGPGSPSENSKLQNIG